jgi:hypothetical protein
MSMTSELTENKWAVLSERGCEATDLTHDEARRLVHKLAGEGRHGLCIVSNEAAQKLSGPSVPAHVPNLPRRA